MPTALERQTLVCISDQLFRVAAQTWWVERAALGHAREMLCGAPGQLLIEKSQYRARVCRGGSLLDGWGSGLPKLPNPNPTHVPLRDNWQLVSGQRGPERRRSARASMKLESTSASMCCTCVVNMLLTTCPFISHSSTSNSCEWCDTCTHACCSCTPQYHLRKPYVHESQSSLSRPPMQPNGNHPHT